MSKSSRKFGIRIEEGKVIEWELNTSNWLRILPSALYSVTVGCTEERHLKIRQALAKNLRHAWIHNSIYSVHECSTERKSDD